MEIKSENTVPATAMPTQEGLILYRILCAILDETCREGELNDITHAQAVSVLAMQTGLRQDSILK